MSKIFLLFTALAISILNRISFSFQFFQQILRIKQASGLNSAQEKFLPCTKIPHVIPMLNNNSVSTAVTDGKNLFVAVTGKFTQIYKFPINESSTKFMNKLFKILQNNPENRLLDFEPFQVLKQSNYSTSAFFKQDGTMLVVGSSGSTTYIYMWQNNMYTLKQTLKNSYFSKGARVLFSADGHKLITIASLKQLQIYEQTPNYYQLIQSVVINLQTVTKLCLSRSSKYFSIVETNSSHATLISLYSWRQNNQYSRCSYQESLLLLVNDIAINNRYLVVAVGLVRETCAVIIYRIVDDTKGCRYQQFQQIFQDGNQCIVSAQITQHDQLILTSSYFVSVAYKYDEKLKQFVKKYQMYHQVNIVPIHTQLRLLDQKYEHLLVYTPMQINLYCPGFEANSQNTKQRLMASQNKSGYY